MTKLGEIVEHEIERPDFGLRVIIVWKVVKACLLAVVGVTALVLYNNDLHDVGAGVVRWMGIDPAGPHVTNALGKLAGMTPGRMVAVGAGALGYGAVLAVEAWGLHKRRVWAEWLTVIVTSSLIPLELYELAKHATVGKLIALLVNVAIVMYLLRHRWLFKPGKR